MSEDNTPVKFSKPLTYIDHNVLSEFTNGNAPAIAEVFKDKWQVIYSLENLTEIMKSKGHESKFTDLLRNMGALYLDVHLDENHRISDTASLENVDPWEKLQEIGEDEIGASDIITAMKLFSLKMMGGRKDLSFEEVISHQRGSFGKLMDFLESQIAALNPGGPVIDIAEVRKSFNAMMDENLRMLTRDHNDGKGFEGIDLLRRELQVNPLKLNNIQPPMVVKKIWDLISQNKIYSTNGITIEAALGLSTNFAYPGKPFYAFEKVLSVIGFLNWVGYYPDKKVLEEKKFSASTSDQSHASYGAFAEYFLTMDNRLAKKADAAYEYLGFRTAVVNMNEYMKVNQP